MMPSLLEDLTLLGVTTWERLLQPKISLRFLILSYISFVHHHIVVVTRNKKWALICIITLHVATKLRIPVRSTHVYLFADHVNDLGSSKYVKGNPKEVYRRMGQGSSYGVGAKLGLVRAEYVVDHNSGTSALFFRFGERF
ncbi:unnamed protein product [Lactuca virosa]|uniref:Bacterial surface antigen (D15) domain-containing protein n=1 Tax=Lactuca virosa TaxID=75947 RepID=A0AAU9NN38_9ASTR|nr:unnamed protein product [Lactuca virosa]